ncbi:hypothetical protein [Anaeromicropila herbilytica]|uniref:J domain-containing protein n=1 Tax=Anaeromicropila herbilytica TaxID=2785025 RepID=A0A7R7EJE6_9FIRM|nr:hypothetical protein [Anaeromicropila herbilytica]BCN29865.1 hypothetical protein bsdtb5_11600 [Anaeromicropila herbilytica]
MNYWVILDIEPTTDVTIIKKAYAKKLHFYHPENDSEGFQMLREAYDSALRYAKCNQSKSQEDVTYLNTINTMRMNIENSQLDYINSIRNKNNVFIDFNTHSKESLSLAEQRVIFFQKIEKLYADFFQRLDMNHWEELMNDDIIWNLDYKNCINKDMLEFIRDHHFLEQNTWKLLNHIFQWDTQRDYLSSYFEDELLDYLFKQFSDSNVPRYCYFKQNLNIDYDLYLKYREEAFIKLRRYDLDEAYQCIEKAYEIYKEDPDLYILKGEYLIKMGKNRKAEKEFKKAIDLDPQNIMNFIYQANTWFICYYFNHTIRICNKIKGSSQYNYEILILITKSYLAQQKWIKASKVLRKLYKRYPDKAEVLYYIEVLYQKNLDLKINENQIFLEQRNISKEYGLIARFKMAIFKIIKSNFIKRLIHIIIKTIEIIILLTVGGCILYFIQSFDDY